jgi:hypothetical protein
MGGSTGTSKTSQNSSQTQQSTASQNPWEPTQGLLQQLIQGVGQQSFAPSQNETDALGMLRQNAQGAGNYGAQATQLSNDLMSGGPDRSGYITGAYDDLKKNLSPYLSPEYLDPTKVPGIQAALQTVRDDASNNVNGLFAGAGRDLSGLHIQNLGRGIASAEAPLLLNQYNQNVGVQTGAANSLYGAGVQTGGALSSLDQLSFQNRGQGLDMAMNGIPAAQNNQANQILQAEAQARGIPLQVLGALGNMLLPIAGLGGTTRSTGTATGYSTGTQTDSPMRQFMQFGQGLGSMMPRQPVKMG